MWYIYTNTDYLNFITYKKTCVGEKKTGGAGHRSRYLSHAKRALYHLSYAPLLKQEYPAQNRRKNPTQIFHFKISIVEHSYTYLFTTCAQNAIKMHSKFYHKTLHYFDESALEVSSKQLTGNILRPIHPHTIKIYCRTLESNGTKRKCYWRWTVPLFVTRHYRNSISGPNSWDAFNLQGWFRSD